MSDIKKFPFDFMECIEVTSEGSYLRTAGDTFWLQRLAYHSASASKAEYIGFAKPGAGISASAWAIKFLGYDSSSNVTGVLWSGGSLAINKMWDDRATYTYS